MVIKEIQDRRSVREYKDDDVTEDSIIELVKAGQYAPSAKNNQAVEFIIIKDAETKTKIFNIVGQEFVKEAPVLIVPVTDTKKTTHPIQDLSVATENILVQAAGLGLGTVWKNLAPELAEEVKSLLGIPGHFTLINLIPVGYPREKPVPHKGFDTKRIHYEKF